MSFYLNILIELFIFILYLFDDSILKLKYIKAKQKQSKNIWKQNKKF